MRRMLLVAALVGGFTGVAAQEDTDAVPVSTKRYHMSAGVHLGFVGGGINTTAAEGRKVNPNFYALPNYGVTIFAPFGTDSRIGARVDVGVSSIGVTTRPYEFYNQKTDWQASLNERYNYFSIAPAINLAGAYVGLGINIPMKGTMVNPDRSDDEFIVDKTTLKTTLDIRIGGMINVWHSKIGDLYANFEFKYYPGGLYNDNTYTLGSKVDRAGDPGKNYNLYNPVNNTPAGFQIGVAYLFDIAI